MSRVVSSPSLGEMNLTDGSSSEFECQPQSSVVKSKKARIRHSISAPALDNLETLGGASASTVNITNDTSQDPFANRNPQDHLHTILESLGISADTRPALSMTDFFLEIQPEHIAGYGSVIINAVCQEDLDALARIRDSGAPLQCCNKFGESIVHMACRRGSLSVFHYLLRNGVSIRLRDDYGRTPLHDACWTQEPHFELVKSIILECPDLLFITDKRGYTPLSYVRRNHWEEWCKFLHDHQDLVVPKELWN
jgi:ankyrin repeat protein